MVGNKKYTPVLFCAFGTALGYYAFSVLFRGGLGRGFPVLLLVIISVSVYFFLLVLGKNILSGRGGLFLNSARTAVRRVSFVRVYTLAFIAGLATGIAGRAAAEESLQLGLPSGSITGISGKLIEDPRAFPDGKGRGALYLNYVTDGTVRASAKGKINVYFPEESLFRLKDFGRGCEIYTEGKISGGALYFSAASVHITKTAPLLEKIRTGIRLGLVKEFSKNEWGGLALALLAGIQDNMDTALSDSYREAGCSHVLALSGMHLALVSALVVFLLKKPLGLKVSALGGLAFVMVYIFLVGAQPSLFRAAIMYLLGTIAVLGALPRDPLNLLGMSFILQIILRPASGTSVSFVLSYLALGGILTAGEWVHALLRGKLPEMLLRPLSASLGAFLATSAVTEFYFAGLKPIGVFASLLIVPLTSVFMIGSILWLVLDFTVSFFAFPLGRVLSFLYIIMGRITGLASSAPGVTRLNVLTVLTVSILCAAFILCMLFRGRLSVRRLAPFD
jgi:competence protein ComEC